MISHDNPVIHHLLTRRSVVAKAMEPTPPTVEDLQSILRCGLRVPDHGKLTPWRVVVIDGLSRRAFGEQVLLPAFRKSQRSDAAPVIEADEVARFERAGAVIAVLSTPLPPKKVPVWEMQLSAGAVCAQMLIAAQALGYAAQWLSEWPAFDDDVLTALGGNPETDRVAGFISIGQKREEPTERARPEIGQIVSHWQPR